MGRSKIGVRRSVPTRSPETADCRNNAKYQKPFFYETQPLVNLVPVPEDQELIECQWTWKRVSASTYASEQCQIEQAALHFAVQVDHPEQEEMLITLR